MTNSDFDSRPATFLPCDPDTTSAKTDAVVTKRDNLRTEEKMA